MVRHIEYEPPSLPEVSDKHNGSLDNQINLPNDKLPHGVAPETYGLLLYADDRKEILDIVDSLDEGKNRIKNPTRKLLSVYYFSEVSGRDLQKSVGGDRVTNGRRMLEALEVIWQHAPPEIQLQYPKEKAVRLKEDQSNSPQTLKKISELAKTIWQRKDYREKNKASRKNNPVFLQHMREIKKGTPSPTKGKHFKEIQRGNIRLGAQRRANNHYGLEPDTDRSTKRVILFNAWLVATQFLGHPPSYPETVKLRREGIIRFGPEIFQKEFGEGSFTRAKEVLRSLCRTVSFLNNLQENPYKLIGRPILERDIKKIDLEIRADIQSALSASSIDKLERKTIELEERLDTIKEQLKPKVRHIIESQIGIDESSIWKYVIEHNLLNALVQTGEITRQELDMVIDYFEKKIIREGLKLEIFDRFTIAAARAA